MSRGRGVASSDAGAKVLHLPGLGEPEVITFHWCGSYGPAGEPMAEQCACYLGYDHDAAGEVAQ